MTAPLWIDPHERAHMLWETLTSETEKGTLSKDAFLRVIGGALRLADGARQRNEPRPASGTITAVAVNDPAMPPGTVARFHQESPPQGWIAPPTRYVCSRHGEHDAVMFIRKYGPLSDLSPFTPREIVMERRYCMLCYIEHLDKSGVEDMEPVRK